MLVTVVWLCWSGFDVAFTLSLLCRAKADLKQETDPFKRKVEWRTNF